MTDDDDELMVGRCHAWTGHVIVCGLRGVGLRTVEQLHLAGVRVAVLDDDPDPRLVPVLQAWGVPHVVGSSRLATTLDAVGLKGAAAIVCVQDDDLPALETALLARQTRPDIRVVALLRNPAVGRAMSDIGVAVLDVAGLSAPSVVEACLSSGTHEIELDGERFVAVNVTATRSGTLRALYGDLAPVAVIPAGGTEVVVCPGRDHEVQAGDAVTLLGTPDSVPPGPVARPAAVAAAAAAALSAQPADTVRRRLRRHAGSFLRAADRRLLLPFAGLVMLVIVSTALLRMAYRAEGGTGMSVVDAVYFNVETVTTIGYGDYSFRDQPLWLQIYAIALMIVGTMLVAVFFAMLTDLLISRRIEEALGHGRVTGLRGHAVVIGLGSVGTQVVERLAGQDIPVVVIEQNPENRYLAQMRALGVPVVIADSTQPQTLRSVGIEHARAVAVLTSDDLANLETGLAVRDQLGPRWRQVPVVLRLFDDQLAETVERSFGFAFVRSVAALAAPWFVGAALGLDVLGTFYVGHQPMLVGRLTIAPGGGLDGLTMGELSARTRVVAISHPGRGGGLEHPPRRGTRFHAGDRAYLIGPYEELLQVLRRDTLSPSQFTNL
ncbi:MAG TPA: NAD-binding protein [Actinocrinis sp.]|jgi:Trk K+ transport system NAD-binding subunit/multidrug transporter EmrE-like cation transporter